MQKDDPGHGPYLYEYYRIGKILHKRYLGDVPMPSTVEKKKEPELPAEFYKKAAARNLGYLSEHPKYQDYDLEEPEKKRRGAAAKARKKAKEPGSILYGY
jgi:hypothetical protein